MNKLSQLIKLASDQGLDSIDPSETPVPLDLFLSEIRPFVFTYEEAGTADQPFEPDEIPSLPFSVCAIELDGDGALYTPGLGSGDFWIMCYICRELEPGKYDFYALASIDGVGLDGVIYIRSGALHQHLMGATIEFIKRLKTTQKGICKASIKIRHKNGGRKAVTTIKDYIYVTPSKSASKSGYGNTIEYMHAFEVAGHWRRIKGTGLNRLGERNVPGATWVRPYEKGDSVVGPIIKTRYV